MNKWMTLVGLLAIVTGIAFAEEAPVALPKTLVVYYSLSGKTELVAKALAECLQADLLQIEDETKPSKEEAYVVGRDAAVAGKSWPVKPFNPDVSGYDRIFVGCPVWFGNPTPAINAFVEQVNFSGKQVVVFVTMHNGGHHMAIQAMTGRISAKGGQVVSSFFVQTQAVADADISARSREIAGRY